MKINKIIVKPIFVSFCKQLNKNSKKELGLVTNTHFLHSFHENNFPKFHYQVVLTS